MNHCSRKHLNWLAVIGAIAFTLPTLLLGVLKLSILTYNIIGFVILSILGWYYARSSKLQIWQSLKPGWALGIILAVFMGLVFLSLASLSNPNLQDELSRADAIPLLARSLLYGLTNAAIVTVFPFIIVWRVFGSAAASRIRKLLVTAIVVVAIGAVSIFYSLGLPGSLQGDFQTNLVKCMLAGVPTIVSGSPLAAPISNFFLQLSEASSAHNPATQDNRTDSKKPKSSSGGKD